MECGVEAGDGQGQSSPHESITIPIFCAGSRNNGSDMTDRGKETRKYLHDGVANFCILMDPKARGKQTFVTKLKIDSVKRHERKEVHRGNLLKIAIECHQLGSQDAFRSGKDCGHSPFHNTFDGGSTLLRTRVHPTSNHLCMLADNVVETEDNIISVHCCVATRLDVGNSKGKEAMCTAMVVAIAEGRRVETTDLSLQSLATASLRRPG